MITHLTQLCCPEAHKAAATRQKANASFGASRYDEALQEYSAAIAQSPSPDAVLYCNRSVTHLKMGNIKLAVADGETAVSLSSFGRAIWSRAWFRLGTAVLAEDRFSDAAFALAMSCSAAPSRAVSSQLVEAVAALPTVTDHSQEEECPAVENVRRWLREANAPAFRHLHEPCGGTKLRLQLQGLSGSEFDASVRQQLECALCFGLLWEPATMPCGHTLCRPCLARSLDHAFDSTPSCPLCRATLSEYLAWLNARAIVGGGHGGAQIPVNRKLSRMLYRQFGSEMELRQRQICSEEAVAGAGDRAGEDAVIPVFICSMAMPAVACPLHIFEPRYRLMMRRCLDSGQRQFGMCLSPSCGYGTMLRIDEFNQLPDGRSALKTLGTRRFRILAWGEKDGYSTARVNWVNDEDDIHGDADMRGDAQESCVSPDAQSLISIVDTLLERAASSLEARAMLDQQLGPKPDCSGRDGKYCPAFVFWCIGLANIAPHRAYEFCFGDSFRHSAAQRLKAVLAHYQENLQQEA